MGHYASEMDPDYGKEKTYMGTTLKKLSVTSLPNQLFHCLKCGAAIKDPIVHRNWHHAQDS